MAGPLFCIMPAYCFPSLESLDSTESARDNPWGDTRPDDGLTNHIREAFPFVSCMKKRLITGGDHTLPEDSILVSRLRRGDEAMFSKIVSHYYSPLLRLARLYVPSHAVAEEVVQETWMGVLEGVKNFEGRSSFQTWLFRILTNRAKTRGERERRYQPMPFTDSDEEREGTMTVEPERFIHDGFWAGRWMTPPSKWDTQTPERLALSKECRMHIEQAIVVLPATQRQVITLRDINGMNSQDVCNILALTETNQRVLLHRARSRVRQVLEKYLKDYSKVHPE